MAADRSVSTESKADFNRDGVGPGHALGPLGETNPGAAQAWITRIRIDDEGEEDVTLGR